MGIDFAVKYPIEKYTLYTRRSQASPNGSSQYSFAFSLGEAVVSPVTPIDFCKILMIVTPSTLDQSAFQAISSPPAVYFCLRLHHHWEKFAAQSSLYLFPFGTRSPLPQHHFNKKVRLALGRFQPFWIVLE